VSEVLLVARREFTERLRDRTFLVTNAFIVVILALALLLPSILGDGDEPGRIGAVGPEAEAVALAARQAQDTFDVQVEIEPVADRAAAERALEDGDLDAVLLDGTTVLVQEELPSELEPLLATAVAGVAVTEQLADAGVSQEELAALREPPELAVESVAPEDRFELGPAFLVGFAGVFVLYGLLILYGQWVAQGIVEEKQSRVVEVLLGAMSPRQLLAGKVLGLGALGLAQIAVLALVGVGGALLTGLVDLPPNAIGTIALVVAWYVLGYALYATVFAIAGALCSRVEDLQSTVMPVYLLLIAAIWIAQFTATDPGSPVSRGAGLVPFTAPILQPLRMAAGASDPWEVVLAAVLTLVAIALLVPLAARFYTGGVLQTRRKLKLSEAWRGAAREERAA
jgi:ABC-2 type transport system permease protein